MKIISKYKDYYDYLQGIWSIDEKKVLNRIEMNNYQPSINSPKEIDFFSIWFCDYKIDVIYDGEYNITKDDKIKFCDHYKYRNEYHIKREYNFYSRNRLVVVNLDPIKFDASKSKNTIECPILIEKSNGDIIKFPLLSNFKFIKIFDAETAYLMLESYISSEPIIINNQSDIEKVISNGFDIKESFRNIK